MAETMEQPPARDDSAAPAALRRTGAADIVQFLPRPKQPERATATAATDEGRGQSTTRTSQQQPPAMKIAFGSCHKTRHADAQIWRTIAAEDPDAFFWTGDAVYPAVRNIASPEQLEREYRRTATDPAVGYQLLAARLGGGGGIFGTWDDHDYGGNDRGSDMPQKRERAALFYGFLFGSDNSSNGKMPSFATDREGVYYSVEWNENDAEEQQEDGNKNNKKNQHRRRSVKAIFLDTRWFRQPHCLPSVAGKFPLGAGVACFTRWLSAGLFPGHCQARLPEHALLGAAQWEWLEAQILQPPQQQEQEEAPPPPSVLIVVSSIQVLTTNPVMESWGHFEAERNRLVRLLLRAQQRGSHVVLLSGDVHHGEILDPFASSPSPSAAYAPGSAFLEVTSSGLTHDCSAHLYGALCKPLLEVYSGHRYDNNNNNSQKKTYYIGRNYGTVNIDWERATVEVAVHDVVNGTVVLTTGARPLQNPQSLPPANVDDAFLHSAVLPCMDGHLVPVARAALLTLTLLAVGGRLLLVRRNRDKK